MSPTLVTPLYYTIVNLDATPLKCMSRHSSSHVVTYRQFGFSFALHLTLRRKVFPLIRFDFYSTVRRIARNADRCNSQTISVRLSVRQSFLTFRCFVQTNEDTIVRFSASGRTIPLVSGEVKFIGIFAGDHLQ